MAFSGLTGWTLFGGLTLVLGAVATRWLVLPRRWGCGSYDDDRLTREAARVGVAGSAVLLVGLLLFFGRQLLEFRDPFETWADEAVLLLGTTWGHAWLRATVGAALLTLSCSVALRLRAGWWVATPLALSLGSFPAFTGHASAVERFTPVFVVADTMHVWAAGAWIGGLASVMWLEYSVRRDGRGTSVLAALVPAFSPVAIVSVGVLAVTGALAAWGHLPSLPMLVSTTWGRLLLTKLGIAAVVLALGARNFRVLTARLGTDSGDRAMRHSALVELVIAQVVLIVTALLVRTSPMGGP